MGPRPSPFLPLLLLDQDQDPLPSCPYFYGTMTLSLLVPTSTAPRPRPSPFLSLLLWDQDPSPSCPYFCGTKILPLLVLAMGPRPSPFLSLLLWDQDPLPHCPYFYLTKPRCLYFYRTKLVSFLVFISIGPSHSVRSSAFHPCPCFYQIKHLPLLAYTLSSQPPLPPPRPVPTCPYLQFVGSSPSTLSLLLSDQAPLSVLAAILCLIEFLHPVVITSRGPSPFPSPFLPPFCQINPTPPSPVLFSIM